MLCITLESFIYLFQHSLRKMTLSGVNELDGAAKLTSSDKERYICYVCIHAIEEVRKHFSTPSAHTAHVYTVKTAKIIAQVGEIQK